MSLLFNIFAFIMTTVATILPTWTIWPQALIDGLTYIANSFAKLNFILPISEWFTILLFFINFSALYVSAKMILKAFNYLRGTGSGIDLK
jgi:hypothetical protein